MIRPSWRSALSLTALCAVLFTAFLFRSRLELWLAPVEADYTESSNLDERYPRPGADLTPLWRLPLEEGYGGATIDGEDVFVLDREPGVADTLRVIDLGTGTERWTFRYPAPGRHDFPGSRTRPIVVDELVYLCSSFGQVHCVERESHEALWSTNLIEDCGGSMPDFGCAASPLIYEEVVILPALGAEVGLVALDRWSGEVQWSTPALGKSHSTPVIVELHGRTQVLFLSSEVQGQGQDEPTVVSLDSFDPSNGARLWRTETLLTNVPIPPPVRVDDEHVFVTGGYGGGSTLLHIARASADAGEDVVVEELFHIDKGSQLHPPVVHGEYIYLLANENANESRRHRDQGGLICLDRKGRELWSTGDAPYFGRGHMLLLGDYLLIQDGQSGILRVALATPRGYRQFATANVFESPPKARLRMWAPMARVGATLIVRGRSELRCVHLGSS